MRSLVVAGVVLLGLGVLVLVQGGSRREVFKVGSVHVIANDPQSFPPWTGGVVLLAGAGLLVSVARKRT